MPGLTAGSSIAFPTHVGVILIDCTVWEKDCGFPHTCGGDPETNDGVLDYIKLSPHMWG